MHGLLTRLLPEPNPQSRVEKHNSVKLDLHFETCADREAVEVGSVTKSTHNQQLKNVSKDLAKEKLFTQLFPKNTFKMTSYVQIRFCIVTNVMGAK